MRFLGYQQGVKICLKVTRPIYLQRDCLLTNKNEKADKLGPV